MGDLDDVATPPSLMATIVGHVLIGLAVAVVTKALFKQKPGVALVAGMTEFGVHHKFDAPVARRLSELGL